MGFPSPPPTGQPSIYDKLMQGLLGGAQSFGGTLTPEDLKAQQQQAMMALGANLLAGSGPSSQRQSFGSILGPSLLAAQQAKQQTGQDQLQALLMQSQIQRAKQKPRSKPTAVMGPDGKPIFVSEEDAIGQSPFMKAGGEYGAYQPGDYTPASWAKFVKSKDPAELERYSTPRQEFSPSFQNVTRTLPDGSTQQGTFDTRAGEYNWNGQVVPPGTAARTNAAGRAEGQITGARTGKAPTAYATYQAGVKSLQGAMDATDTGPLMGRLPAFTAAQQTAEGAQAIMAPILKQLFRDAGEGTFTDSDQALLMQMVPTRTDRPEARKAKIGMIDSIVRAKLNISETDVGAAPAAPSGAGPAVGAVEDGFRFKGGDPADQNSWERAQ